MGTLTRLRELTLRGYASHKSLLDDLQPQVRMLPGLWICMMSVDGRR